MYDAVDDIEYIRERITAGCVFGAFVNGEFAGGVGIHDDGSIGMLKVLEEYRGRKIGAALETYIVNYAMQLGWTPYGQVEADNTASLHLQKKLGMHLSKTPIVWMA
uniref:GNAT family N-acetyltransferase n=1 Tax=Agathobacter sp. TaxID=2021311 RepID=UPI004056B5B7